MARPIFELGARLSACAELVRPQSLLVDVGTDHAYLPVWLIRAGRISRALAVDINQGPLEAALRSSEKYGISRAQLELRLSDGLRNVESREAEDIVIAGMGGQLILRIISEIPWLRNPEKRLVLQPMSSVPELREGLCELGFQVERELAVIDSKKVYSAFSVSYHGGKVIEEDPLFLYMGRLGPGSQESTLYGEKMVRMLENQSKGLFHKGEKASGEKLFSLASQIIDRFCGGKGEIE